MTGAFRRIGLGLAVASLGHTAASMIDRVKPIRIIPATFFVGSLVCLRCFFFVRDKLSAAVMSSLIGIRTSIGQPRDLRTPAR